MKLKRYVNGAWIVVDKELKQLTTATDSSASPITITAPLAEPFDNYRVYGATSGVGDETGNLLDMADLINAPPGALNSTDMDAVLTLTLRPNTTYTLLSTGFGSSDTSLDSNIYRSLYFNGPNRGHCVFAGRSRSAISDNDGVIKIGFMKSRTNAQQYINGSAYVCLLEGDHTSTEDDIVPYGYQIPLVITSGAQSITTPLYIGSSKLYEEEYLDYASGKVYKRTENDFPFAKKGTFAFGDNGNIISDGEGKFVISITSAIPPNTTSALIPLNMAYMIPQSVGTGGEFTFYLGNNGSQYRLLLVFYDANGVQIEQWSCDTEWRKATAYSAMTGKTIAYIGMRTGNGSVSDNIELTPMFSKNTNLTTYIPYLQPTDPPVPVPSVQHYEGESTISVGTTVAPDKLELTYQGWRVAANPEPKIYKNGQWMTEYRRVEYLKSNGTQIIDTDIIPLSTTRTEMDVKFGADVLGSSATGYERPIVGAAEVDSSDNVTAQYIINALKGATNSLIFYNKFTWRSGITANYLNNPDNFDTADNAKQTIAMQGGTGSWGSTSVDFSAEMQNWPELSIAMCVFGAKNAAGGGLLPFKVKELSVYEMRTYDNNILTHNLIPVERQIDGELGLYDTITDTFYTNSGTGTFVKGGYI